MSIKLGTKDAEVTLAVPNTFNPSMKSKGAKHELQSGAMMFDLVARKWMWRIAWRWLTTTEKGVILTQAQKTSLSLIDFDSAQFDVEMTEPLNVELTESTDPIRYHISMTLEQR